MIERKGNTTVYKPDATGALTVSEIVSPGGKRRVIDASQESKDIDSTSLSQEEAEKEAFGIVVREIRRLRFEEQKHHGLDAKEITKLRTLIAALIALRSVGAGGTFDPEKMTEAERAKYRGQAGTK